MGLAWHVRSIILSINRPLSLPVVSRVIGRTYCDRDDPRRPRRARVGQWTYYRSDDTWIAELPGLVSGTF
jgi:hypothetical protein